LTRPDRLRHHRQPDRVAALVAQLQVRSICPHCEKRCYASRKTAKRAAALLHPGVHMRRYRCGDFWHFGPPLQQAPRRRAAREAAPTPVAVAARAA